MVEDAQVTEVLCGSATVAAVIGRVASVRRDQIRQRARGRSGKLRLLLDLRQMHREEPSVPVSQVPCPADQIRVHGVGRMGLHC